MKRSTFLAWMAGIPVIGKAMAGAKAKAASPNAARGSKRAAPDSPLDAYFSTEAKRIEGAIKARYERFKLAGHSFYGVTSELHSQRVCFHDARSWKFQHHYTALVDNFISEAVDIAINRANHVSISVEWRNIPNANEKSTDYNPLASWGRFVARISNSEGGKS